MHIQTLKLTHFRNIAHARLDVGAARVVALYGHNGAGKTSVLEALSLLSPGRGLNGVKLQEYIQKEQASWGLFSELATIGGEHAVGMSYEKNGAASGKRQIKIDGDMVPSQAELGQLGNVLWFSPKMDRLFLGPAQPRREFLDRMVYGFYPDHAQALTTYRHHLKARTRLLKDGADPDWIGLEEDQAAVAAAKIMRNRHNYLTRLKEFLDENGRIKVVGSVQKYMDLSDTELADKLSEEFKNHRMKDAERGSTAVGPHRCDVVGKLYLDDKEIFLGHTSSGQHKRAVLSVLLANARLIHSAQGELPLMLFDEVSAHLDKAARETFTQAFLDLGAQIWLAGTDKDSLEITDDIHFIHAHRGQFD